MIYRPYVKSQRLPVAVSHTRGGTAGSAAGQSSLETAGRHGTRQERRLRGKVRPARRSALAIRSQPLFLCRQQTVQNEGKSPWVSLVRRSADGLMTCIIDPGAALRSREPAQGHVPRRLHPCGDGGGALLEAVEEQGRLQLAGLGPEGRRLRHRPHRTSKHLRRLEARRGERPWRHVGAGALTTTRAAAWLGGQQGPHAASGPRRGLQLYFFYYSSILHLEPSDHLRLHRSYQDRPATAAASEPCLAWPGLRRLM